MLKLILRQKNKVNLIFSMFRWHARYYLSGRGLPVSAGVYITDVCNSRCMMCSIWKNKDRHVYPRRAQEQAVDALAKMGCYYYSVSGGEPVLVDDLAERLAYAAKKIPYVHLVTNGLVMNENLARRLASSGVKEISISIDGTEEFHNTVRGLPNAYQKTWTCLEYLRTHAPHIPIVVNSLLTPYNLEALRILSKRLRIFKDMVYQKLLPLSVAGLFQKENLGDFAAFGLGSGVEEIDHFLDEAARSPHIINSSIFLQRAKAYFRGEKNLIPEQNHCSYPYHAVEFDSRGCAYPCITGMNFKNGISPDQDLVRALNSSDHRGHQRELKNCTKCQGMMTLCYYEPRLNFPIENFIKSRFAAKGACS